MISRLGRRGLILFQAFAQENLLSRVMLKYLTVFSPGTQ